MSKPPPKKNSYALLLKGLKEVEKTKQPKKASPKKNPKPSNSTDSQQKDTSNNETNSQQEKSFTGNKTEIVEDPDIPDRSYGDYYCKICDSHMNAVDMWEAHVTGKRHIKNVEKGDTDSKYEDLPDAESSLTAEMKAVKDPVVGLSYIHEIRRKEPNIPPIYNCFLCHASLATIPLVTEHVLSLKHRFNYIKENSPEEYSLISATNLKKGLMEPLVVEAVIRLEEQSGRGKVKVKQEKQKKPVTTYSIKKPVDTPFLSKKPFLDQDKPYNQDKPRFDANPSVWGFDANPSVWGSDANPSVWGSVDAGKRRDRNKDFEEGYRGRSRSRSPRRFTEKQMYPEKEYSMINNRRPFPDRDPSPEILYDGPGPLAKRDISPKYDYKQDYLQPRRRNDMPNELNYATPRHHTRHQEHVRSPNHPSNNHFLPRDLPPAEKSITQPSKMGIMEVLKIISILPMEDRFQLLAPALAGVPEVTGPDNIIFMLRHICEIRKKITENELFGPLMNFLLPAEDAGGAQIPGLGEANNQIRNITARNQAEAQSTANNTFKDSNYSAASNVPVQQKPFFPSQPSSTYTPSANSQQTGGMNVLQGNYQIPSGHPFQTHNNNSFGNQLPFQNSGSSNVHNPPLQNFYSQSSSSIPKSFNSKY